MKGIKHELIFDLDFFVKGEAYQITDIKEHTSQNAILTCVTERMLTFVCYERFVKQGDKNVTYITISVLDIDEYEIYKMVPDKTQKVSIN